MSASDFTPGAGFRIVGYVVRRFVPPSGKVAFLTLDVPNSKGKNNKIELRTFESDMITEVGALGDGMTVQVTGSIDVECLKDKSKKDVQIDGRAKWVPALTIKALKIEPSSVKPKVETNWDDLPAATPRPPRSPSPAPTFDSDDDVPF